MDVEIINENNIVVDGVEYVAVKAITQKQKDECVGCELNSCPAKIECYSGFREDNKDVIWKKKSKTKTVHELFNEWCGEKSSTNVSKFRLNGEISSKQIGLWRRKKNCPTPNAKSKAILKRYGFDWDKQSYDVSCGYKNGDIANINGKDVKIEIVYQPEKPENFTLEFEYVNSENNEDPCFECYYNIPCGRGDINKRCRINDGYIIKRVKNYIPLTRENAMVGLSVRQTTESGYLHGTISYIKKHQDQCVVDWGTNETTICFASLEILED